ncbi:GNAT family N-acetyltransferase [Desulfosporosinus metallidurans]|uniref:Acetyltransferase n=1 Tax=Desulfosporosinus metallidurans TaxID=1888891 RepID=A0A1Q8QWN0_9FIRM|nr:GNAT family protein [Desulfosporosinus metallidurans]OLN31695.1 Acetyltransferase [Desulfosporosinus metallidurans]
MAYLLCPLSSDHMNVLYGWKMNEPNWDLYTCRPVGKLAMKHEFAENLKKEIAQGILQVYVIAAEQDISKPLGRITLFDFNLRNSSAEFGYYIPAELRSQGIGQNMMRLLLERVFEQDHDLNKVYATTSSNNEPSIRLLERNRFTLDGRLREHYWIRERRYDQLHYSMLRSDWG